MKRWPLGFLLVLAFSANAESFWDGAAAVQRGEAAFEAGMFAVSNAFAPDTEIVVEDLATGKTTSAVVTGRLEAPMDLLVLLSPAAALPLGLEPGEVAHVRVTVKRSAPPPPAILAEETAPIPDPDRVPPAVRREETIVEPAVEPAVEESPMVAEAPVEQPVAEAPAEEPIPEAVAEAPAEAPAEQPVAVEPGTSAEDAALLAELAARSPQKQLFLPPREDEMFAYQEPVEPPAEAAAVEVVAQPQETAPTAVEAAVAAPPEIASSTGPAAPSEGAELIPLPEAMPPEEQRPELVESLVARAPEPEAEPQQPLAEPAAFTAAAVPSAAAAPIAAAIEPEPAPVVAAAPIAAPAEEKPPVAAAAPAAKPAEQKPPAAAVAPAAKPAAVPTVLDLPGTGAFVWYLQLAAYSTEAMARDTAAKFSATYPVLVLAPPSGSRSLYRVFIGPLNRAESGTLLNYFRYRGFPDAFVRTAQK